MCSLTRDARRLVRLVGFAFDTSRHDWRFDDDLLYTENEDGTARSPGEASGTTEVRTG